MTRSSKAFSLIEILIVIVFLGILAAIVIPQFAIGSGAAQASVLADNLRIVRTQLEVFKSHHRGGVAGYPQCNPALNPSQAVFSSHMAQASDVNGNTAAPGTAGFDFGPYLMEMPENPVNGKSTVQIIANGVAFPGAADDTHGWIYKPETMTFKPDSTGSDEEGTAYFDY